MRAVMILVWMLIGVALFGLGCRVNLAAEKLEAGAEVYQANIGPVDDSGEADGEGGE